MKYLGHLLPILALSVLATAQSASPTNSSLYMPAIATKLNTIYIWYAGGGYYEVIEPLTSAALNLLPVRFYEQEDSPWIGRLTISYSKIQAP